MPQENAQHLLVKNNQDPFAPNIPYDSETY
jgi:hypothetical protein